VCFEFLNLKTKNDIEFFCSSSGLSSDFLPLCVVSCWHCRRTFNIFLILEELPNIGNRPNSVWEGAKGGTKGGEECDSADNFQLQLRRLGSHPSRRSGDGRKDSCNCLDLDGHHS